MANNKVQLANGTVLIDITDTTAVASDVAAGKYFYDAAGVKTLGTNSGGGGSGTIETGSFTVASNISISVAGTSVTVGFSGHPDFIYCWMDLDSFKSLGAYINNRWYRWALTKNDPSMLSSFPFIRVNGSVDAQTLFESSPYIRAVSSNVYTTTDANNTVGYSVAPLALSSSNPNNNRINSDGTLTLARFSSATSIVLAGTYHYIAITGATWYPA